MANRAPTPPYSESLLSNYKTPPADDKTGNLKVKNHHIYIFSPDAISEAAMKELIAQKLKPLWIALGDAMKKRAEMNLRIGVLEASETNLGNQVENVTLNNAQLVDEVEKMRIIIAGFIFFALIWLLIPNQY